MQQEITKPIKQLMSSVVLIWGRNGFVLLSLEGETEVTL